MKISECNHIRIRDDSMYGLDVEQYIKFIEAKHNIDFRSLPQWKELVKRLHVSTTDCKRKIQDANLRNFHIINKLYTQFTRNSPFELTDKLARTHDKWANHENGTYKIRKVSLITDSIVGTSVKAEDVPNEISEYNSYTAHQNTEVMEPDTVHTATPLKLDDATDINDATSNLPLHICVNQHKLISPWGSQDFFLDYKDDSLKMTSVQETKSMENMVVNNTSVKSCPREIYVTKDTLEEQTIRFTITNFTTEYMHLRFLRITDDTPFKRAKIVPPFPKRLYPGIAATFKLIFKLNTVVENFSSALFYKIGKKILAEEPVEAFIIPIVSKFKLNRSVTVTDTIHIPSAYLWQVQQDSGFPSGTVNISVNDDYTYHLHVTKRAIDITQELQDSFVSVKVISPDTDSFIERMDDNDVATHSEMFVSLKEEFQAEDIQTSEIVKFVVDDIIELAVDTFVFNHTYLYLEPQSKKRITLYFSKPARIGSHHCYYDFKFYDVATDEILITKTIRVFAEILPHPVKIYPALLDMSMSPVTHGFCEDQIIITNTHKVYPVTIKMKLTTKMKKILRVTPMESLVPSRSQIKFNVKLCSKDARLGDLEDLVHLTFKIVVTGDKSVYKNVPPFFYEMIVPCASMFKKVYNEKYFREI